MMIVIKKTSNSRIGIPDYKVKKCVRDHEDLDIRFNGMQMIIKCDDIKDKVLSVSDESYPDRFGMNEGREYHLYFFTWNPLSTEALDKMYLGY